MVDEVKTEEPVVEEEKAEEATEEEVESTDDAEPKEPAPNIFDEDVTFDLGESDEDPDPEPEFEDEPDEEVITKRRRGRPKKEPDFAHKRVKRVEEYIEPIGGRPKDADDSEQFSSLLETIATLGEEGSISVDRVRPREIRQIPSCGMLERYGMDENVNEIIGSIKRKYGGGRYKIRVLDARGRIRKTKDFALPGRPLVGDEEEEKKGVGADGMTEELRRMQFETKKLELEADAIEKKHRIRKRMDRLEASDEDELIMPEPSGDDVDEYQHKLEMFKMEQKHRDDMRELRHAERAA